MKKLPKKVRARIQSMEAEIKEDRSLWKKIKTIPKEQRAFVKKLWQLLRMHPLRKKPKVSQELKEQADAALWDIEPPPPPAKRHGRQKRLSP